MIYDCFTFFNEFDLLEIRLHELNPWVDRFVLVECAETFSGEPKPLWFDENKHRFEDFLPKIEHVIAPVVSKSTDAWDRQEGQRDCAKKVLTSCADSDLILIGDVDEIVRGRDFVECQGARWNMTTFIHRNYFYYMNLLRPGGWPGTVMIPYVLLKTKYDSLFRARKWRRHGNKAKQSAWHFSNMGGKEAIKVKLKASCHFNTSSYKKMIEDERLLDDLMSGEARIKGRKLRVVPIDDSYPIWFRENLEKFKHLLTKEVPDDKS